MAPEFRWFAEIGAALMKLHIDYEKQAEYPLERRETGKLNWRVEKMTLSKDKSLLKYNENLGGYEVNVSDQQLKGAPHYSRAESWDWNDRQRGQKIYDYYGATPYWM